VLDHIFYFENNFFWRAAFESVFSQNCLVLSADKNFVKNASEFPPLERNERLSKVVRQKNKTGW
jgi:hypothetical protein